ncbi:MAG: alpha/beta hydrolase [Opitutaceae bacterium]|nr:alpha/beta hydrolase [Opitutaceae bacterium]
MPRLILLIVATLTLFEASSAAKDSLYFREDWRETPFVLPITPEHVANSKLKMEIHGPGKLGIKKSHHDHIENDPYYIWSGQCPMPWALSLRKTGKLVDLSSPDANVRWRSRQSGDHALHLLIKLPGERWFISEQSDSGQEWHDFEFRIQDLTWRHFSIIKAVAKERVPTPSLAKIEQIGFTDQKPGKSSKFSSRLDWIEVHGAEREAPPKAPPAVKAARVETTTPETVREYKNLVYAKYDDRELTLDLYQPKTGKGPFPAVVFIHGGGWYKGDPSSYTALAQQLSDKGYVTLNIFYRLSGEASFPTAIHDCKSAVRWARANAQTFRIDPSKIGSVGGSAGGHLSGLLGTSGQSSKLNKDGSHLDFPSALQACAVMAGSMDLTTERSRKSASEDPRRRINTFMGGTWRKAKPTFALASPITHVSKNTPPMLFMDGEYDSPGERYPEIIRKLDTFGIHHESHVIENAPHPFWSSHPFFDPSLEILSEFFDKFLKSN